VNRYRAADRSGAIAQAGVAQTLMGENPRRVGMWIQNNSVGDLWINELGDAAPTPPSIWLAPGMLYEWHNEGVPSTAISIYGAALGQAWSAREW
jgi:hypothetical protein